MPENTDAFENVSPKDFVKGDVSVGKIHVDPGVVDAAFAQGMPEGFETVVVPAAEDAATDTAAPDAKPEGWDDPWYWEGASDEKRAGATMSPAQEAVSKLGSYYKFGGSHNYHFGSGDGTVRVETEAIRDCAASGKATLGKIEELIQAMLTYVSASEGYWKGDTGDDFREGFAAGMKDLQRCLVDLAPYTRELIAYADRYEGVITQANAIAEGIGDVTWQDV